jgi:menaquinone-dependent protoporphyrinogen oxidase
MTRVLVVYGSRHGGTKGIAERIGEVLRTRGIDAAVTSAELCDDRDVNAADAFVVGSGVYMGSWLKEPLAFIERYEETLAARPLWLFSSGPLPGSSKDTHVDDPIENALGPTDGPGSGGRKKVEALVSIVQPRDHRVFQGAFDPHDPPKAFSERVVRIMPAAKKILPEGDFREWDDIEAWAGQIAAALTLVPAG